MSRKSCPVCGTNSCRIAADGNSGYCKRDGPWKVIHCMPKDLVQGPIRHEKLSPESLATARSTYQDVGRYLYPSFEQWELGFLRDCHPERELRIWTKISIAFNDFLARSGRNPEQVSQDEGKLLISHLTAISGGGREPANNMDDTTFRELVNCYAAVG